MRKVFLMTIALLVVMTIGAWAQGAGLSQGQAVKQATATPARASKTCPHCGITKGNITYPWQHESWCPYYRARNSGTTSGSSRGSSSASIVASGIAAGVGSSISNAFSNWLNSEPKKDYSVYKNTKPGSFLNILYDYDPNKEQKYVVLRAGGKVGIWENAWTYHDRSKGETHSYPGEWIVIPKKYDYIWVSYCGTELKRVMAVVGVKQKNSNAMFYGLNNANRELIKANKYTKFWTVRALEDTPLVVAFGYTDDQGRDKWDLWKVVVVKEKKVSYVNAVQVGGPYDDVAIWNKYVRVTNGGRSHMLDHFGKDVFNRDFAQVGTPFGPTKMAWAQDVAGGKYGVIDSLGHSLLPCEYDMINILNRGVLLTKGDRKGYYYADGRQLPCEYDKVREYGDGLLVEKDGNTWIEHAGKSIPLYVYNTEEEIEGIAKKWGKTFEDKSFANWYARESAEVRAQFMKKDEFEKESDHKIRIADKTAQEKYVSEKMGDAMSRFLTTNLAKDSLFMGSAYDSEMECFEFFPSQCPWNAFRYPVAIADAKQFKSEFSGAKVEDRMLRFDTPSVKQFTLKIRKKVGKYGGTRDITYNVVLSDD
ncbi:MAG: WG repeat-containing protein [Bacteroidaceae bacterium]|nr:WG repeat-containing protein [Bacteroidaceae bacterium]